MSGGVPIDPGRGPVRRPGWWSAGWWSGWWPRGERGDVPGWVLVTLMTAGLVLTLWAVAGPRLEAVFTDTIDRVVGGP